MKVTISCCILFMVCYLWRLHRFSFRQILLQEVKDEKNFSEDLKKRFNSETDMLIFMCRSGGRSCDATNVAASKASWPINKIYNMMGGFEGDKVKNEYSVFHGKRVLGGWKNEGLPWTYKVDSKLAYPEAD